MKRTGTLQRSYSPPDHALAQRVSSSAAVSLLGVALRAVITIGSTAVLARLLAPADFGLLTMASLVTEFAALFSSFGIGAILIQSRRTFRLQYDTAFWFAVGLGVVLMAAVWVFSTVAGLFFDDPRVPGIVRVLSLLFLLEELTVVHAAVLNRLLKFKLEVAIQTGVLVLRVACTIFFAWLGWGVWALVMGTVVMAVARMVALWLAVPYRPRLRFHFPLLRQRLKTGFSFLGIAVVGYLNSNLDYLIVGRRFGATDLGYYQAAYSLADELRNRLSMPLQRVLFPAYSLVQDALPRFQNGVLTGLRLLAATVMPLGAGMAATAPEIVRLLYGERWLAVVPLLQILAMNGALRAVFSMCGAIFYARDRASLALLLTVATLPFVVVGLWIGVHWGPAGVAWAMLALVSVSAFNASIAMRQIGLGPWHLLRAIGPALVAAGAMAAAVLWLATALPAQWGPALRLAAMVPAGAVAYAVVLALVSRSTVGLMLKTIRGLLGR